MVGVDSAFTVCVCVSACRSFSGMCVQCVSVVVVVVVCLRVANSQYVCVCVCVCVSVCGVFV